MSSSSRDYYKSGRDALPPIRDVLGDQLDRPPRHDSAYSFDDVNRALPVAPTSSSRFRSTWPQTTGPTLPPIHHSHSRGYATSGRATPTSHYHTPAHQPQHHQQDPYHSSSSQGYTTHSTHQPPHQQDTPVPYSFDVFRPSSSGLVHASSSSRSQGILRSTRADAGKKHAPPPPLDEEEDQDQDASSKRYACPHCGKRFGRPSSLKTHEVVHSDEKPYECYFPGCGKTFTVPSNMRRHYRKVHEASGGQAGSGDEEGDDYEYNKPSSSSRSYYTSSRR